MSNRAQGSSVRARLVLPDAGQTGKIFCPGDCLSLIECIGVAAMLRARCEVCRVRWSRVRGTGETNWGWIGHHLDTGEITHG